MAQVALTVKSISSPTNAGTSGLNKTVVFIAEKMELVESYAAGADTQFEYNGKTFIVDEAFAVVSALLAIAKSGINYVMGIIDMADTAQRTIATHDMKDINGNAITLPKGAVILDGIAFVKTTFTSATDAGTIALGVETDSAAGLKAAIAISNGANPWDAGKTALIPVGTAATALTALTADRKLQYTVAVEALTAGKMVVYVQYIVDPTA